MKSGGLKLEVNAMQMYYETGRLILRILRQDAAASVLDFYLDNREIFEEFEPDRPENFYTLNYQAALLNCEFNLSIKSSAFRFWVFEKKSPEHIIGTISFHNITRSIYQSCQLGYKFDQQHWHYGYAHESIQKAISLIFEEVKLHRLEAVVLPSNIPSIRLLESLGFQKEGICQSYILLHGRWADHLRYSLIRP